jgi:hypothetical protein
VARAGGREDAEAGQKKDSKLLAVKIHGAHVRRVDLAKASREVSHALYEREDGRVEETKQSEQHFTTR